VKAAPLVDPSTRHKDLMRCTYLDDGARPRRVSEVTPRAAEPQGYLSHWTVLVVGSVWGEGFSSCKEVGFNSPVVFSVPVRTIDQFLTRRGPSRIVGKLLTPVTMPRFFTCHIAPSRAGWNLHV